MLPTADLLGVRPTSAERLATLPGDDLVPDADVVMDRAFGLVARPSSVWPWIGQLGKGRSGWYFPRWVEVVIPLRRRGIRRIDPALQHLRPGDVIPDWGGPDATFEVVTHEPPHVLVHRSTRGRIRLSWAIVLRADGSGTRVHLRLRMAGIRRRRLAEIGGGAFDLLTVAGLAAGLRERLVSG